MNVFFDTYKDDDFNEISEVTRGEEGNTMCRPEFKLYREANIDRERRLLVKRLFTD